MKPTEEAPLCKCGCGKPCHKSRNGMTMFATKACAIDYNSQSNRGKKRGKIRRETSGFHKSREDNGWGWSMIINEKCDAALMKMGLDKGAY